MTSRFSSSVRTLNAALGGLLLLLAGCLHERLTWSPDGRQAAVITLDGLYLTDAAGTLSPLLLPGAYRAAWCPDSTHLVVARKRELKTFQELATLLGPVRTQALIDKAEAVWQPWKRKPAGDERASDFKIDRDSGAVALYLREHHREPLRERFAERWKDIESVTAEWHTLHVVRATAGQLEPDVTLQEGLCEFAQILPGPAGTAVAWVAPVELGADSDPSLDVWLSPLTGQTPPVRIVRHVAGFPDWAVDGRTLLVLQSTGRAPGGDDLRLGSLTAYPVLGADGQLLAERKGEDLAGLIFNDTSRVRALRDGRVLFNAVAFHLPMEASDEPNLRDEFFVVEPQTRRITRLFAPGVLEPLPKSLAHVEVSPDEAHLLVSDDSGKVWLLTLAGGQVEVICAGFGKGDSIAPAWRAPGDFTYRKPGGPRNELIQRSGGKETVLSRTWPAEVLARMVESPEPGAK
jgi:hypothetical protein